MFSIPDDILARLQDNSRKVRTQPDFDPQPLLKLFAPWSTATWLICQIDANDATQARGIADLGVGQPEFGAIPLRELASVSGPNGQKIEVDRYWDPQFPISMYIELAQKAGRINY